MSKHGETQRNDVLGIRKIFGDESILPCFGLNFLLFWENKGCRKTRRN